MATKKMSVHQALSELKLYQSKLEKMNGAGANYIASRKNNVKMINGQSLEDFEKNIKSNFQKMSALISNRKRIKDAVVLSNAETKVKIGSQEMTVAEAIERKASLTFEKMFYQTLLHQYQTHVNNVNRKNEEVQKGLEQYLSNVLGDKPEAEMIERLSKKYVEDNEWTLIDPMNVSDRLEALNNSIEEFQSNVDYILSESNATTFITVELED